MPGTIDIVKKLCRASALAAEMGAFEAIKDVAEGDYFTAPTRVMAAMLMYSALSFQLSNNSLFTGCAVFLYSVATLNETSPSAWFGGSIAALSFINNRAFDLVDRAISNKINETANYFKMS